MTVHKLCDERTQRDAHKFFEIEDEINNLKVWTRALYQAVMAADSGGENEDERHRSGLAILLASLVMDKSAELFEKYHREKA